MPATGKGRGIWDRNIDKFWIFWYLSIIEADNPGLARKPIFPSFPKRKIFQSP
jgi:hypothetical protein